MTEGALRHIAVHRLRGGDYRYPFVDGVRRLSGHTAPHPDIIVGARRVAVYHEPQPRLRGVRLRVSLRRAGPVENPDLPVLAEDQVLWLEVSVAQPLGLRHRLET